MRAGRSAGCARRISNVCRKKMTKCSLFTKFACQALRDHHVEHHTSRYVRTLMNVEYQKSINISQLEASEEISQILSMRRELQTYTVIQNGKRVKKVQHPLKGMLDLK